MDAHHHLPPPPPPPEPDGAAPNPTSEPIPSTTKPISYQNNNIYKKTPSFMNKEPVFKNNKEPIFMNKQPILKNNKEPIFINKEPILKNNKEAILKNKEAFCKSDSQSSSSSTSSPNLNYPKNIKRRGFKVPIRIPKVVFGQKESCGHQDVDALALPLGMAVAAVISQDSDLRGRVCIYCGVKVLVQQSCFTDREVC
ncbi:hypothetical protein LIER_42936 [Lithospermum erythrorhizon]|uniref:Uncharacterized protein n=1 Tax=Lithospermum erythrorhizon TaxID=34254 RepID=A0AAV3P5X7_LITER